ncbi:MAG: hypothetical protein ACFFHD_13905 [Promethearchaeota archaeon]
MVLAFFSITFMIASYLIQPYIALNIADRDLIVILCAINLIFCIYYLWQVVKIQKIFKLENKDVIKFGKNIGIVTSLYIPHFFIFTTLFFRNLHNLELLMVILISSIEILLIFVVIKEVYDLVFKDESQRDFELEENRKKYFEKEKK